MSRPSPGIVCIERQCSFEIGLRTLLITAVAQRSSGRGQGSRIIVNRGRRSDEYFVDGVVEEITADLSRVRNFFVIASQSAFTYKGRFV
ncbi:hypothetical protein ACC761_39200, partial [Rhizobium ruizarguesonis]